MASHQDGPPGPWRTKGAPHYLVGQVARLGLPSAIAEHPRVKDNRQLAKIAGSLGQLQREYYATPRHGDDRNPDSLRMRGILGILESCEGEIGKVHAIAGAAAAMVGEAYDAFGLPAPDRRFSLVAASDSPAESVEVVRPATITAEEVASLRSEIDRLRAENESLSERLTEPVPSVPTHTNPHHRRSPARP